MTQFIVVRRRSVAREPTSRGLAEVLVGDVVAGVDMASLLECRPGDLLYKIVSCGGGEADILVDAVVDAVTAGREPDDTALFLHLKREIERGGSVAMWYGVNAVDLPIVSTWQGLRKVMLMQVCEVPPELYGLLVQRAPGDGDGE